MSLFKDRCKDESLLFGVEGGKCGLACKLRLPCIKQVANVVLKITQHHTEKERNQGSGGGGEQQLWRS